jgi:linoleoyl-CoA desaturase
LGWKFEWAVAFHDIQIGADEYAVTELHSMMAPKSQALLHKVAVMAKIISSYQLYPGLLLGKRSAARL